MSKTATTPTSKSTPEASSQGSSPFLRSKKHPKEASKAQLSVSSTLREMAAPSDVCKKEKLSATSESSLPEENRKSNQVEDPTMEEH